jgi:hypothetical protein
MKLQPVLAQRLQRRSGSTYLFSIPISSALELLEIPDPSHPFPDNRRVSKKHAMDFGNYWEIQELNWVVPPLLIDNEANLKFERVPIKGNENLVTLQLPIGPSGGLRILDGQHRILGWYLKKLELESRVRDATSAHNSAVINKASQELERANAELIYLEKQLKRIDEEHVAINLIDGLDSKRHQQYFVDIARNALGINKTVQSKFDSTSIVNRVTQSLIVRHPLLLDRVDMEKTSCSGSNPNLLTVVNISDIVRHVSFGIRTRVNARREAIYEDHELEQVADEFLTCVASNIEDLRNVQNGGLSISQLRESSLIASATIWRCLAGAFYECCVEVDDQSGTLSVNRSSKKDFEQMLIQMSQNSELPISKKWFATQLFPTPESKAPSSRAQDLNAMANLMAAWAESGEIFLPKNAKGL